jgi:hypothetical protein
MKAYQSPNGLFNHNPRPIRKGSVEDLIVNGLGYCCEWKFFSLYHDTSLIAARLGVSERIIRRHKQALTESTISCEGRGNCMKLR